MYMFSSFNIALFVTLGFRSAITLHDLDMSHSTWSSICEPHLNLEMGSRLYFGKRLHVYNLDRDRRVLFYNFILMISHLIIIIIII